MKRPAFQFYPADWRGEIGLRLLPLAAKGLWLEMMCLMHDGNPYGHLTTSGGVPIKDDDIARLVGAPPRQVGSLLTDLEQLGVFSRTDEGTIFCRRMVRDELARQKRAAGGELSESHPNASRRGDPRGGGRPPSQTEMGLINNPLQNPPTARASSSSSSYSSLRSEPLAEKNNPFPALGPGSPPWAFAIDDAVVALADTELRSLSTDDRVVLGRYHALHFANCTKSESANRAKGASISASLSTLAVSREFGDFTVAEYVFKAREYHALIDCRPWFKPWDLKAVVGADVLDRRAKR
jgi:hypothetical protein